MRALLPGASAGAPLDQRAAGRSSGAAAVRADAGRPPIAGPVCRRPFGDERRAAGDDARDQRSERRSGRHHAGRAQPRVPEPGAVDGALLAQAGGARPAVGRRRARGEEPAERDDDPPRAAAAAVLAARPLGQRRAGAAPRSPARRVERAGRREALQHVDVIANEIRRLDEVVQGFLKFTRPEDLKLQPVSLAALLDEVVPIVQPEAERAGVTLVVECTGRAGRQRRSRRCCARRFSTSRSTPVRRCPNGGTLRIQCTAARGRRVLDRVRRHRRRHQAGAPEADLRSVFHDKEKGSGIGLSMVYRTVQMHDGEIEVQSTPGTGTTFRVLLPQA